MAGGTEPLPLSDSDLNSDMEYENEQKADINEISKEKVLEIIMDKKYARKRQRKEITEESSSIILYRKQRKVDQLIR